MDEPDASMFDANVDEPVVPETPDASGPDAAASGPDAAAPETDASGPNYDCAALDCDDGDVCTVDTCDEDLGCAHAPRSGPFTLEPATADFVVTNGVAAAQDFVALQDGVDVTGCLQLSQSGEQLGVWEGLTFTPAPNTGGVASFDFALGDETLTLSATLRAMLRLNTGELSEADQQALDGEATPATTPIITYPYDGTVFPLDVLPPIVQWTGAQATDLYRIRLTSQYFEAVDYFKATTGLAYEVPASVWELMGRTGKGGESDPVSVELRLMREGALEALPTQTWRIAQGRLNSVVYYRELNDVCGSYSDSNGRLAALAPATGTASTVTPSGTCVSCHDVSRDGRNMLTSIDGATPFPTGFVDLTSAAPRSLTRMPNFKGTFSAFNPSGDKVLLSADSANGHFSMLVGDVGTGEVLASNVLGTACAEPAWSPDGKLVAAICGLSGGGWAFDSSAGALQLGSVAEDGFTITPGDELAARDATYGRPSYPSFSPDSKYIVYARTTSGSRSTGNGHMYLAAVDGSFTKALANTGAESKNFYPSFAPRRAGGYYWIALTSKRSHGANSRPLVYMAAIKDDMTLADPSRPAFLLRGQLECAKAYEPRVAPTACRDENAECTHGSDCCSGTCLSPEPSAQAVCTTQPAEQCVLEGNRCAEDSDCCDLDGHACVDRFCQQTTKL